jgi:predicted nucleic acid-binding protein
MMSTLKSHYLDASALVKLLLEEEGSELLRTYFRKHTQFYTTPICFAETLGVLKTKYHGKDVAKYLNACDQLMTYVMDASIVIDEKEIANQQTYSEVEKLAQKHGLDISDAFQIVTLRRGLLARVGGESWPILITADSQLADAVRQEGLRVWDCMKERVP